MFCRVLFSFVWLKHLFSMQCRLLLRIEFEFVLLMCCWILLHIDFKFLFIMHCWIVLRDHRPDCSDRNLHSGKILSCVFNCLF